MLLKPYQAEALDTLRRFLEEARIAGPKAAFEAIVGDPERAAELAAYGKEYRPLEGLPEAPQVCLRLPTGGGKTILAAHAIAVARDAWIERDRPLVLWLVPTDTIRRQTVQALRKTGHPYRKAVVEAFGHMTRVLDIADFVQLRPQDLGNRCCIVVGTIQTLRVKSTQGRKVYAHHEDMEPHFSRIPADAPGLEGLERLDGGGIKFSFVNLLHLCRPLMIVDEAHNAVTGLTREMQTRVNPCAVIEFTATPRRRSNVLYSVGARELKREEMIKLPIVLHEHDSWQGAVSGAVAARASLAEAAKADPGHIRPVALFQAQPKDREVTVEALKRHLVETERVPEERIAVATGDQRELDRIDLFDRDCLIEHVITVEALKEGWDCSFAYVFCSVSRIRSARDVEQLLGRVLRMPYARRREDEALNRAYAFANEPVFGQAARALTDKLVGMGFERDEAEDYVTPELDLMGGRPGPGAAPDPAFRHRIADAPGLLAALERLGGHGVAARPAGDGRIEIEMAAAGGDAAERAVRDALPEEERADFARRAAAWRAAAEARRSPAGRGERLTVPGLAAEFEGELALADTDLFMEGHDWTLSAHPFRPDNFSIRETARGFEIDLDLDGRRLSRAFLGEEAQTALDLEPEGWTVGRLASWLDWRCRQIDVAQDDLLAWLTGMLHYLTAARGLPLAGLARCKFELARMAKDRIEKIRREERGKAWQRNLFAPAARPRVSFDHGFVFRDGMYADVRRHRGRWKPKRHFLGPDRVPAFDGAADGEEARCAEFLDSLPGVRHWVRNVARHPASFWLPVANGRFYPDFIAELEDGRLMVVEYKGAHIADGLDTAQKRTIGELWERESAGRGLFAVVEKERGGRDARQQLLDKVG